jgi:hypothetical protein
MRAATLFLLSAAAAATAQTAQVEVHGVRANGDWVRFDLATGAAHTIASTGIIPAHGCNAYVSDGGQSATPHGAIALTGTGADAHRIYISPLGAPGVYLQREVTGLPAGYTMACGPDYVLLVSVDPAGPDLLAQVDSSNAISVIGPTGRTDLTAFASVGQQLFAVSSANGGALYSINPATGAATLIGGQGTFGPDTRALTAMPDGSLMAAGSGLRSVNTGSGAATLIGQSGFTDIVALTSATDVCYANCTGGGHPPLNVADFTCFLQRFAAGDYYANCDRSTASPTLNVSDFTCFLQKFAAGCP